MKNLLHTALLRLDDLFSTEGVAEQAGEIAGTIICGYAGN
jgi:hypothetical protein